MTTVAEDKRDDISAALARGLALTRRLHRLGLRVTDVSRRRQDLARALVSDGVPKAEIARAWGISHSAVNALITTPAEREAKRSAQAGQ